MEQEEDNIRMPARGRRFVLDFDDLCSIYADLCSTYADLGSICASFVSISAFFLPPRRVSLELGGGGHRMTAVEGLLLLLEPAMASMPPEAAGPRP